MSKLGIADWFVKLFTRHLRSLGPNQIRDLIREAQEVETLERLQAHLISEDFRYWHSMMGIKKELMEEVAKRLYEMGVFQ